LPQIRPRARAQSEEQEPTAEKSALPVGVCSKQSKRPYQEDAFSITAFLKPALSQASNAISDSHYFGLYDGHAGGRCSKYLSSSLSTVLAEDQNYADNLPQALKRSFHTVNDQFLRVAEQMNLQDGSTCIVVIIRDDKYMIANVGDCRAVLITGGKPIQLSKDQKPTNVEEQRRIAKLGGTIVNCMGVSRVNGVLAVARAFGNKNLRHVIRPDAEITQRIMSMTDEYLIIASDGLWDVLSNKDVSDFCSSSAASALKTSMIAEELVNMALARGSMDNTTCICVRVGDFVKRQLGQGPSVLPNRGSPMDKSLSSAPKDDRVYLEEIEKKRHSPDAFSMGGSKIYNRSPSSHSVHHQSEQDQKYSYAGKRGVRPSTTHQASRLEPSSYHQHQHRELYQLAGSGVRDQPMALSDSLSAHNRRLGTAGSFGSAGAVGTNGGNIPLHEASPISTFSNRKRHGDLRRPTTQGGGSGDSMRGMVADGYGFRSIADPVVNGGLAGAGGRTLARDAGVNGGAGGGAYAHTQARLLHSPVNLRVQQYSQKEF
jgi:serine/threonine protein phosphatase PrpC